MLAIGRLTDTPKQSDNACRAGFRLLRVHDLKHTFGHRLRAAGVGFEDRKTLLGHKSDHVTTHNSAPEISYLIATTERVCELEPRKSHALVLVRPLRGRVSACTDWWLGWPPHTAHNPLILKDHSERTARSCPTACPHNFWLWLDACGLPQRRVPTGRQLKIQGNTQAHPLYCIPNGVRPVSRR